MDTVYAAPAADALVTVALAPFVAVFDRRSGITHLLAEPAPQLLAALADGPATAAALGERLERAYHLPDLSAAALSARIDELVAAGLVDAR